ncbi:CubicO group peptidase (beta-lactamase class C family) [Maritalea mobilis]|uniref:CubicO group peptidase (Beta-lactamase class C family) n=1 Tax=Maritalea mobilis TaxID=483324 RepID=A0A4R6VPD9_9HYPH|nr:serine hydrolase [Maritalea mobilis]TDQ64100.1 CubicO group peptidase (beta-lactamase class C family) [Maritalea mobilis]
MRRVKSAIKWIIGALLVLSVGAFGFLLVAPPDLLRVGTNYAAKIVCSNVFIANRDAQMVLREDVQAPGHPLLRHVRLDVDEDQKQVTARLFGIFAPGTAAYRDGLGCAALPSNDRDHLADMSLTRPEFAQFDANAIWPTGDKVIQAQSERLQDLLDNSALVGPNMRATIIVHKGRIVAERYGEGFDAQTSLIGWSMTKTVNAALVGALLTDDFTLNRADLMTNWHNDTRANISLKMLMGMESGLAWNEDYGDVSDVTRMLYLSEDAAAFAAGKELQDDVGNAKFEYSSGTSVVLSRIWQNQLGRNSLLWPDRALFEPLGMRSAVFEADASGTFMGSSYLYATAQDWARFGLMMANGGQWNGKQILPESFYDFMVSPTPKSVTPWGENEYGQGQLWLHGPRGQTPDQLDPDAGFGLPEDMIWMLGHDGQSIAISREAELVVVRMGLTPSRWGYKPQPLVASALEVLRD